MTPQLEERLRNQKLESLLEDATRNVEGAAGFAARYNANPRAKRPLPKSTIGRAATGASAEVLVLDRLDEPLALREPPDMDSAPDGGLDDRRRPLAGARRRRRAAAGVVDRDVAERPPRDRRATR